jgi:hypothetical protein
MNEPQYQQETNPYMEQYIQEANRIGEGQDPNSVYGDLLREERTKNILSQLNPDTLVEDIEHRIRGEKKNRFTDQWEPISKTRIPINEHLIANYVSYLGSVLNQNTSLSNFSDAEINNLMTMIIEYIRDDLTDNDEEYGLVGNYNEMTRIGNIVCMTSFAVFKRALNGMEARRLFASLRVSESLTQQPQKKSFLDSLKFWS